MERELAEDEAESAVTAIKEGLNAVLESSTEFFAPFVGSVQVSDQQCYGRGGLVTGYP